jgi:hypothetical protein
MKPIKMQEFFNPWCLIAIVLFSINNLYWKLDYPNWITGKLSDFAVCYFLPLYVSALLSLVVDWKLRQRLRVGVMLTALIFTLVKTSGYMSGQLNLLLSQITTAFGFGPSANIADPGDLIALPLIGIAYLYTIKKMESQHETALVVKYR